MNTWQELTITVSREAEEAVSNILIDLGSQGVAIDDSADYLGQVDQYGELFPIVRPIFLCQFLTSQLNISRLQAEAV